MPQDSPRSVLVVDDEELIRWSLQRDLSKQGYRVITAATGAEALAEFGREPTDVVLLDVNLPDVRGVALIPQLHELRADALIIMITSDTTLQTAVESVRLGAWDYLTKPFDFAKLYTCLARAVEGVALKQENKALRSRGKGAGQAIVAESDGMRQVLELAGRVMASDPTTVLLYGESGIGKDLVARHIHQGSPRASRLFLDLNCAALPEALLESELFGHERGAFTDAREQKQGLLELAAGGTVYLDEVADAPLGVQAKLLKVLEQRTFRRLGGVRDIAVDVRVIAATNRPLEESVAAKTLREDLYYRLKVFPIRIPPLRERPADVVPLARLFIEGYDRTFRKRVGGLEPEAEQRLLAYRWPGNVRELRNVIERAMILAAPGAPLSVDLLPPELTGDAAGGADEGGPLAQAEARLIRDAMAACGGNQSRAATQLGISRGALSRKLRRLTPQ